MRLVSAYKDRIGNPRYETTKDLKAAIIEEFGRKETLKEEENSTNEEEQNANATSNTRVPSFPEFVSYLRVHHDEMRGKQFEQ